MAQTKDEKRLGAAKRILNKYSLRCGQEWHKWPYDFRIELKHIYDNLTPNGKIIFIENINSTFGAGAGVVIAHSFRG